MSEVGSLAERLRQAEVKRLEIEQSLEVLQLEHEELQERLTAEVDRNQRLHAQLATAAARLTAAKATIASIRSSYRYRLGSRLVAVPLKLKRLLGKAPPPPINVKKKPVKRLAADRFQDDLRLLEKTYLASGHLAAERLARETFKAPPDLSVALMRLSRWAISTDLNLARKLATDAVALAPNPSKKKWLAFLLYDAGEITASNALLEQLPAEIELKEEEKQKVAAIKSCALLLNRSLSIPVKAETPSYIPKPKRILYVAASSLPYHVSGYTLRTQSILKELRRDGWDVSCITRPGYPADRPDTVEAASYDVKIIEGVPYQALQGPSRKHGGLEKYLLESADIIARQAIQEQAAAIHAASNYENAIPALIAARRLGLPFIYEVRGLWEYTAASKKPGWDTTERFELDRKLEALAASSADKVLTLTQALADELAGRGVSPDKIALAPNGIDVDAYRPVEWDRELAESLGICRDDFVVGYIGSVVSYEGLDDLLNAFAQLRKHKTTVKLLIVGGGDALPALQQQALELALDKSVVFVGKVAPTNVPRYYSLLSVVSLPRKPIRVCELVSPLKPYEVMAMGVPLVVSDVAALKEMVEDGETAIVHRAGDSDALSRSLLWLSDSTDLANRLARLAMDQVTRKNSWRKVAQTIEASYQGNLTTHVRLSAVLENVVKDIPAYAHLQSKLDGLPPIEQLQYFPILDKSSLIERAHAIKYVSKQYRRSGLKEVFTGGSSGTPLLFWRDRSEHQFESGALATIWDMLDVRHGDKVAILRARANTTADSMFYLDARNQLWVYLDKFDPESLSKVYEKLNEFEPALLRGYGGHVLEFAKYCGLFNKAITSLKGVAYSSETLSRVERDIIRSNLSPNLVSVYGQSERVCMAYTTPSCDEFHIVDHYGFVELLREDGSPIEEAGELGEIVATPLYPRATGFIRYRTGDMASWSIGDCRCGTKGARLSNITGRTIEQLFDSQGNLFPLSWDQKDKLLRLVPLGKQLQFVQVEPGCLEVRFTGSRPEWYRDIELVAKTLSLNLTVSVKWDSEIYVPPSGKRILVYNKLLNVC